MDIETIHGLQNEDVVGLYVRGHVDHDDFRREALAYAAEDWGVEAETIEDAEVTHEWWRKVPTKSMTGPSARFVADRGASRRGAFPVTTIELEAWDR